MKLNEEKLKELVSYFKLLAEIDKQVGVTNA